MVRKEYGYLCLLTECIIVSSRLHLCKWNPRWAVDFQKKSSNKSLYSFIRSFGMLSAQQNTEQQIHVPTIFRRFKTTNWTWFVSLEIEQIRLQNTWTFNTITNSKVQVYTYINKIMMVIRSSYFCIVMKYCLQETTSYDNPRTKTEEELSRLNSKLISSSSFQYSSPACCYFPIYVSRRPDVSSFPPFLSPLVLDFHAQSGWSKCCNAFVARALFYFWWTNRNGIVARIYGGNTLYEWSSDDQKTEK